MIIKNAFMNCFDSVRDKIVNGEHLTLTISHRLKDSEFTGWFASITTHDPETDETDWGFCSGWCSTYREAIASLKANPAYSKYTYPIKSEKLTVCFTGHRPKDLYGYEDRTPYAAAMKKIMDNLLKLGDNLTVITGGAQGIDQLAFWAAEHLKRKGYNVTTVVAVPFKGQELRWKTDGMFGQNEYKHMLKLADKVEYLSDNSNNAIQKLDDRNHWMVDYSDLLVCVTPYDNIEIRNGGTGNCVRYAIKKKHKYVVWKI